MNVSNWRYDGVPEEPDAVGHEAQDEDISAAHFLDDAVSKEHAGEPDEGAERQGPPWYRQILLDCTKFRL